MDGQRTEWAYDANGNRTHENGQPIASYDAQDRLLTWKDQHYSYSPAGDLQAKTSAAGQTRYDYDALGNLRQVQLPGGQRIDYDIDPLNRRIGKRKNGQQQYRLIYLDELRPLAELDAQGQLRSLFIYAGQGNAPTLMLREGKTWRLIADHLGSIRLVIDAETGQIGQRLDYDAWGRVTHDSQPGFQPFGFAGGLYDPDTGLTRFSARDYDAETGRWTAKDPILFNGGDSNLYGYVLQDPVNFVDPSGLANSGWRAPRLIPYSEWREPTPVMICFRPVDIDGLGFIRKFIPYHAWIKTPNLEAGMGGECEIPGQQCSDKPYSQTVVKDHSGQSESDDASCIPTSPTIDIDCVERKISTGQPTGRWTPLNQCQSFAYSVIDSCRR
ncbi:hypothetical protein CLI92_11620 [Vandammella animalimorsus]|uniref:Teneurin-like YD-shell domain-containing protein n=1 Tax=Vandammella animalimorsus TaxID=2029117 RepID=A0A2A2T2Q3_9BURK|nr:RHS repeat-associated core domain-containing protein [Vandammella animalimorsus]PAT31426.1 hypothetical protein CK626_09900 [Vandammella animalimorsus]PAX15826.1 hypothetical protein CLI92_11620 [Vandammella animalimorsus]PAX17655.1 hypothetical protein CLI93_12605 [Vandammella animalimorsus]